MGICNEQCASVLMANNKTTACSTINADYDDTLLRLTEQGFWRKLLITALRSRWHGYPGLFLGLEFAG